MARTLKLYKSISPNTQNGSYYHFTSFSNYLTSLGTPYKTITLTDYRITQGAIEVKTNALASDAMLITYAVEQDGDYHRCYHVAGVELFASSIQLRITTDLWGSYYDKATMSDMVILRSTRNIGNGIYPAVNQTTGGYTTYSDLGTINYNLSLVISTQVKVVNALFGEDTTANYLFAIDIPDPVSYAWFNGVAAIDKVSEGGSDISCGVVDAWIVEKSTIALGRDITLKAGTTTYNAKHVHPVMVTRLFANPQSKTRACYAGTINNNMKIDNYTSSDEDIIFKFIASTYDMTILVGQGEKFKDITSAFNFRITNNGYQNTNIVKLTKAVGAISSIAAGASAVASGNLLGAAGIIGGISQAYSSGSSARASGGDAYYTFWNAVGDRLQPYKVVSYEGVAIDDYRVVGCYFNKVATISDVFAAALLPSCTKTFVQASCNVSNIPTSAADFIRSKLASGIYLTSI